MREFELKYGCNPNQKPAKIYSKDGELPIEVLNGKPGYIAYVHFKNDRQLSQETMAARQRAKKSNWASGCDFI